MTKPYLEASFDRVIEEATRRAALAELFAVEESDIFFYYSWEELSRSDDETDPEVTVEVREYPVPPLPEGAKAFPYYLTIVAGGPKVSDHSSASLSEAERDEKLLAWLCDRVEALCLTDVGGVPMMCSSCWMLVGPAGVESIVHATLDFGHLEVVLDFEQQRERERL